MLAAASGAVTDIVPHQEQARPQPGLTTQQFLEFIEDIRDQPAWRKEADKNVEYYDGNQLDHQTLADLKDRGMPNLITNLIKPTIDVVLGMQAKNQTDWRVAADSDELQEVAEGLSAKLNEAERETRADRAKADAYANQIKAGFHCVEVGRNANPFKYIYRVGDVHRREVFWDWRSRDPAWEDAKYIVRKRWFDLDQAIAYFPKQSELLRAAVYGWPSDYLERMHTSESLAESFENERRFTIEDYEWRNTFRRRVCLFETWYRIYVRGYVMRLKDGRAVELNPQNMLHKVAIAKGLARPEMAVYSKLRMSIWAGPHRLQDVDGEKPYTPYVPYWGYREDLTGIPYGLIRAMVSPQDEINARKQKLMWLLSAKRLEMDSDALDPKYNDVATVLREVARPDGAVILNPNRKNMQHAFKVEADFGLAEQQFKVMMDAKASLQEAAGLFNAMLGRTDKADSGIAIASLVEQGATVLAEINDNFRYASRLTGERLLDLVREDCMGQTVVVMTGEPGRRKPIVLNQPVQNPQTGAIVLKNDVEASKVKVALEDVPQTPAYRAQQMQMLTEVMRGLPPQLQAVLAPFWIEASALPDRREIAELLRKQLGLQVTDPETMTPDEKAQFDQQQAVMAEQIRLGLENAQLVNEELRGKADKAQADARYANARADGENVDTALAVVGARDERANAQAEEGRAQANEERTDVSHRLDLARGLKELRAPAGEKVAKQAKEGASKGKGTSKTFTIKKQPDGSYVGEVTQS